MPAETEITNDIMLKWIGYVVLIVVVTLVIIWFLKHRKKYEYKGVRNYHPSFMSLVMGQKPRRKYAKNEDRCRAILEKFYGKRFPSCRPPFLKNPLTKKNLELDCFCKELNIALEYNGQQHYHYTPLFHKTEKDFYSQVHRDNWKRKRCKELGISLIEVPYWISFEKLEEFIKRELLVK